MYGASEILRISELKNMLHFVTTREGLNKLKPYLKGNDTIVCIDEGVYVAENIQECRVFVLADHVHARGISVPKYVSLCEMSKIVELVVNHPGSSTWT